MLVGILHSLTGFTATLAVIDMLAEVARTIQHDWQLEREARVLAAIVRQSIDKNEGKSKNQIAIEIARLIVSNLVTANNDPCLTQNELFKLEAAHRDTNEELEERVEERTAQLQQAIGRLQDEIAERQHVEKALRESRQRLAAIAANVPGVVYRAVLQSNGSVSMPYISPRTQEIFGLSPEEFMEHLEWVFDMVHPEDRSELNEIVRISAENLAPFEHEYRVSKLFQEKLTWVRIISQPHRTDDGDVVWDGVIIDITERKQTEESLRRAEENYRSIFENAIEGIFQVDPNGRYIRANPSLARICGYNSPQELIANIANINLQLYVDASRRAELIARLSEYNAVSEFESQIYRKDGRIIWVSENARTVRDIKGNILYYEGILQDITERKRVETELQVEQDKSERLLLNILPSSIAEQLKQEPTSIANRFDEVTILFADIVDFTSLSSKVSPSQLLILLNEVFCSFDLLAEQLGLEKIKTIGDAYMVVGGLPMPLPDHAAAIAEMAIAMQREIATFKRDDGQPFSLRIGINTGPVIAGVIGIKKFIYDLWGDAVNVASRMESQGLAGGIQVTEATYQRLRDKYIFEERGPIDIKGKGEMTTYMLLGRKIEPFQAVSSTQQEMS